jgi:hypothetical protein
MAIQVDGSKMPALASDQDACCGNGYGQNGPQPSSLRPNESAPHALNIDPRGGDQALDMLKANGMRAVRGPWVDPSECSADAQRFKGAPANHPHMKDANSGGAPSGDVPGGSALDKLPKW